MGGIWSLLGPLGSFLELFFSCLYLEWSSKVVLEASGLDFGSILEGLGSILGGFWEGVGSDFGGFWVILACSGLFRAILGYWGGLGQFWEDFGWCCLLVRLLLLAIACFCLLLRAIACYCALLVALAGFSLLFLAITCFLLAFVCFCWLLYAAAQLEFKFKISCSFWLLLFAWACVAP